MRVEAFEPYSALLVTKSMHIWSNSANIPSGQSLPEPDQADHNSGAALQQMFSTSLASAAQYKLQAHRLGGVTHPTA